MKAQMISLTGRRKKKLERQVEKYLNAIKSHRKDYKLHIELGDAYAQLEDAKKSAKAYYSAIGILRQAPNIGKTKNLIIELYEKITKIAPADPQAYVDLSEEYISAGQKEKAFRFLLSSAKRAYEAGNYEAALQCYNQAIEKGRTNPYIVERCTELYIKLGRKDEAMQNYVKIGDMYAQEEKNIEALEYYKKACGLDNSDPELLLKVARMYNAMAWTENAASELVKVGEYYEKQEEYTEALRYYQYSIRLDPENEKAQEGKHRVNESYLLEGMPAVNLLEEQAQERVGQDVLDELDQLEETPEEPLEAEAQGDFEVTPLDATMTFEGSEPIEATEPPMPPEAEPTVLEEEQLGGEFGPAETPEPDLLLLESDAELLELNEEESPEANLDFVPTVHTDSEILLEEEYEEAETGFGPAEEPASDWLPLEQEGGVEAGAPAQPETEWLPLEQEGGVEPETAEQQATEWLPLEQEEAYPSAPSEPEVLSGGDEGLFMLEEEDTQVMDFATPGPGEAEMFPSDANALPAAEGVDTSASSISLEDWIIDLKEDELVELALEEALREQEAEEADWGEMFGLEPAQTEEFPQEGSQLSLPASSEPGEVFESEPPEESAALEIEEASQSLEEFLEAEYHEGEPQQVEEESAQSEKELEYTAELQELTPEVETMEAEEVEYTAELQELTPEVESTEAPEEIAEDILNVYLEEAEEEQEEQEPGDFALSEEPEQAGKSEIVFDIETAEGSLEDAVSADDGAGAFLNETEESQGESERIGITFGEDIAESEAETTQEHTDEELLELLEQVPPPEEPSTQESLQEVEETLTFSQEEMPGHDEVPETEPAEAGELPEQEAVEEKEEWEFPEDTADLSEQALEESRIEENVPEEALTEEEEVVSFLEDSAITEDVSFQEPVEEDEIISFPEEMEQPDESASLEEEPLADFIGEAFGKEPSSDELTGEAKLEGELEAQPPFDRARFSTNILSLRRRIEDLEQQLERTEEEKYFLQERFTVQISQHKAHEESLQKEIADVYKDKEDLEKQLQQTTKGHFVSRPEVPRQQEVERLLTPQKDDRKFDDTRYGALVDKIERKKAGLQQQLHKLLKQREDNGRFLTQELQTLNETKQRLQHNLEHFQKVKARLEERINTELQQAKRKVQSLTKTSQDLESKLKSQHQAEQQLRKQFHGLRREKEQLQTQHTQELETFTQEKTALEQQLKQATTAKKSLEKALKKKVQTLYRSYQRLKTEYTTALASKEAQIAENARELSRFADKYVKLEKTLAEIRKERDKLNKMLVQETTAREQMEEKLVTIESQVDSLEIQGSKLLGQLGQELDRYFNMEQLVSDKFQLSMDELEGILLLQEQEIQSLEALS